jgi:hypothetical protein
MMYHYSLFFAFVQLLISEALTDLLRRTHVLLNKTLLSRAALTEKILRLT